MADVIPPSPTDAPFGSYNWQDWFFKVRKAINAATSISWSQITSFTGSNLNQLATRSHQSLQSVLGTTTPNTAFGHAPTGGTVGQALVKLSSTDYDYAWGSPPSSVFRVYYNTTTATVSGYKIIPFNTVSFDPNGYVNTGTGRATLPSGTWNLYGHGTCSGIVPTQIGIFKNGTIVGEGTYGNGDGSVTKHNVSELVQSNGTDVFDVRFYSTGTTGTISGGTQELCYFYGVKVA
jgi:hypothetical protein